MAESAGYGGAGLRLCRYAIYESGFAAFDINLYSSQLYPGGEDLSLQDNILRTAVGFGLCSTDCAGMDIITRGEAAFFLYTLLTKEFSVTPPPMLENIFLRNKAGVHLNDFLLELQKSQNRSVRHLRKEVGSTPLTMNTSQS